MTTGDQKKLSERLRDLMEFYHVSYEELARDSRVSVSDIMGWTQEEVPLDGEALGRVANMLGVSAEYLLTGVED